jgi:hypothetical protein
MTIMKTTTTTGLKMKSAIKAGYQLSANHNRAGLKVKSAVKAGGLHDNHNRAGLKVKSAIRCGYRLSANHNIRAL